MEASRQLPKTLQNLGEVDILELVVEKDSSSNRGIWLRWGVRRRGGAGLLGRWDEHGPADQQKKPEKVGQGNSCCKIIFFSNFRNTLQTTRVHNRRFGGVVQTQHATFSPSTSDIFMLLSSA
jgi:hypothetical protein